MKIELPQITPGDWRVFKQHAGKPDYMTWWTLDSSTRRGMAILTVYDINSNPKWQAEHPEEMKEYGETMQEVGANAQAIAAVPALLSALAAALTVIYNEYPDPERLAEFQKGKTALLSAGCTVTN